MKMNRIVLGLTLAGLLAAALPGCMKDRSETAIKGRVHIVVDESVAPVFSELASKFQELYQDAKLTLDTAQSREAIVAFFNVDSTKVIATARPLNAEEIDVAKRTDLQYTEFKVAINAVAVITHPNNPVKQMRTTQLDSVLRGMMSSWKTLGGSGAPIAVCLPDQNSAAFEIVAVKVLHGEKYASPAQIAATSADMIKYVGTHANALGLVSVSWLRDPSDSVKVIEMSDPAAPESLGIAGQYFTPHQAYVYQKFYPLTAEVYMYSKADMYNPGSGFITFVTSGPGQKIVQNSGLVPATMPVRLVQLNRKES